MITLLKSAFRGGISRFLSAGLPVKFRHFLGVFAIGAAMTGFSAQGAKVVEYDTTLQPGSQVETVATTVAEGLSAAPIVRGPGIEPAGLIRSLSSQKWNNLGSGTPEEERLNPTRENAIATGEYFEFAITAREAARLSRLPRSSGTGSAKTACCWRRKGIVW